MTRTVLRVIGHKDGLLRDELWTLDLDGISGLTLYLEADGKTRLLAAEGELSEWTPPSPEGS